MYCSKVSDSLAPVVATVGDYLFRLEENTRETRQAFVTKVTRYCCLGVEYMCKIGTGLVVKRKNIWKNMFTV